MDLINSFAVVAYIDDPVAAFVDRLRCELTPGCPHLAHVTILRPRPLSVDPYEASEECRQILSRFDPFEIRLGAVDVFESTEVIKLTIESGVPELRTLHDILNTGPLQYEDEFEYVPHVTLCKDVPSGKLQEYLEKARRHWAEFTPVPPIPIETLTLVQQTTGDTWENLFQLPLGRLEPAWVRR